MVSTAIGYPMRLIAFRWLDKNEFRISLEATSGEGVSWFSNALEYAVLADYVDWGEQEADDVQGTIDSTPEATIKYFSDDNSPQSLAIT